MQFFMVIFAAILAISPLLIAIITFFHLRQTTHASRPAERDNQPKDWVNPRRRQNEINNKWRQAQRTHDELNTKWHAYETNLQDILARPLMRNLEDPAVAEAVRAMGRANALRTTTPPRVRNTRDLDNAFDYIIAVNDYEHAFNTAHRKAETQQLENFTREEQKKIERARNLLTLALDTGATNHERQAAYRQVIKLINDVKLSIPQEAIDNLQLAAGGRRSINGN